MKALWRMLCIGFLICFVSRALGKDALISVVEDCCVHKANQVLCKMDKFGGAEISSSTAGVK